MTVPPPDGHRTVSAYLIAPEAEQVMAFAGRVFGARPATPPLRAPGGRLVNVPMALGDSVFMLAAPMDGAMRQTAMLHVYVADCDAVYAAAVDAGAESVMAPSDQFYGDRAAGVRDVAGNLWWIATRVETLDHAELERRVAEIKGR
jgi:uncharacterized glyoxalase superfamily protein PhnB